MRFRDTWKSLQLCNFYSCSPPVYQLEKQLKDHFDVSVCSIYLWLVDDRVPAVQKNTHKKKQESIDSNFREKVFQKNKTWQQENKPTLVLAHMHTENIQRERKDSRSVSMVATELLVFLLHWVGCLPACLSVCLSFFLSFRLFGGICVIHRAGNLYRMQRLTMLLDKKAQQPAG